MFVTARERGPAQALGGPCAAGYNGSDRRASRAATSNVWGKGTLRTGTIVAFALSVLIQVGYPLLVTVLFRRAHRPPWALFVYGALVYALFQLFSWLPLNVYLDAVLGTRMTSQGAAFWWLLISAAVGAFLEEGGRWLGYRFVFPKIDAKLSWRNGVMYGLGHGSVETLLLFAGLTFVTMLAYVVLGQFDLDLIVESLGAEGSPALIEALRSILDMQWSQPLIVAAERVLALSHQIAWSLMVMTSLFHRRKRWFAFALAYHTSVAVLVPSLATLAGFGVAEGVNLLLAVFSLWIIAKLRAFEEVEPLR
jgi:uncharacterized membrane protein YhfC